MGTSTLSKNQLKLIKKLKLKKYREQENLFLAEGEKVIETLIKANCTPVHLIYDVQRYQPSSKYNVTDLLETDEYYFDQITQLKSPPGFLGVFEMPQPKFASLAGKTLVLDGIKDPGNLGTIVREAAWFGVDQLILCNDCVDPYNAKVVQSSMGSIAEIPIHQFSKEKVLELVKGQGIDAFVADLTGEAPSQLASRKQAILIIGSESHGPSDWTAIQAQALYIKSAKGSPTESLNAAVASGILLYEWSKAV